MPEGNTMSDNTRDQDMMMTTPADQEAPVRHPRRSRPRLMLLAMSLAALVLVGALGGVSAFWGEAEADGLVFVIPAGAAERLEMPTIDSAIQIPVDIRFGPNDVRKITIINEDSTMNRAGPWLVDAGQRYTLKFDKPGVYQFDCTVDASESVTVTVTD
jgi:plastocyanin